MHTAEGAEHAEDSIQRIFCELSAFCGDRCDPPRLPADDQELDELQEVEARVTDDRRHCGAPAQIDNAPERAEDPGGDRRVHPLLKVTEAESRAGRQDPERAA